MCVNFSRRKRRSESLGRETISEVTHMERWLKRLMSWVRGEGSCGLVSNEGEEERGEEGGELSSSLFFLFFLMLGRNSRSRKDEKRE